jgi:hypothetical protein
MKEGERRPQQINQEAQENVTHQPPEIAGLTSVEKARQELVVFLAGAERTSPRFTVFTTIVSEYERIGTRAEAARDRELSRRGDGDPETGLEELQERLYEIWEEQSMMDGIRKKRNQPLSGRHVTLYGRVQSEVDKYLFAIADEIPPSPSFRTTIADDGREVILFSDGPTQKVIAIARKLVALREELIARQQPAPKISPQE